MKQLNYIQVGDQTYSLQGNSSTTHNKSYTIPTCIWAGRGCIDLDALKDVDYILIGPSNKRPILWVTNKELKQQTKSLSDLYQQWLDEGNPTWDSFEDELDWKIRFEAFLSRELDVSTGVKYTTENELKPIYKLGSRYYLKQGKRHTPGLIPKNFIFRKNKSGTFFNEGDFDQWKEGLKSEKSWKDLRYKHPKLHKYATKNRMTGEIHIDYKYIVCFLTRISNLSCNTDKLNGMDQFQDNFINSSNKEFRPVEIVQNPFNRKIGGCLKVIKNTDGKVIELRRINITPTIMYEKCLKKFLTFDDRGYNTVAIRYHNPITFRYKSPSFSSSWKMLYGIGSYNRKRIYCKYAYRCEINRNGITRPMNNNLVRTRTIYSAYRNPFYSGFFTHYDICAKARVRCISQAALFPEWEKLKEHGSIRIIIPSIYLTKWFNEDTRVHYYKTAYVSPSKETFNSHVSYLHAEGNKIPIEEFVQESSNPPFTYNRYSSPRKYKRWQVYEHSMRAEIWVNRPLHHNERQIDEILMDDLDLLFIFK